MTRILFCWELGGGSGHISRSVPIIRLLREREHEVYFALRDVSRAPAALSRWGVKILQAPYQLYAPERLIEPTFTYPQLLHNVGYSNSSWLRSLTEAWLNLYRLVNPEIIVADHSPTALLAARGSAAKRVCIGTGFSVPPNVSPLPALQRYEGDDRALIEDEVRVMDVIRAASRELELEAPRSIGEMFANVDEVILTTLRELDHYSARPGSALWGVGPTTGTARPDWPAGTNRRIFAYLKQGPGLVAMLTLLNKLSLPTVVCYDGIDSATRTRFTSETLRFQEGHVDLQVAGRECFAAVLNATHGATSALLLQGKPVMLLPQNLEQEVLARKVAGLELGVCAEPGVDRSVFGAFAELLNEERFRDNAANFAALYRYSSPQFTVERWLSRLEELAAGKQPSKQLE